MTRGKNDILDQCSDEHKPEDFDRLWKLSMLEVNIDRRTELWQIREALKKVVKALGGEVEQKQTSLQ